MKLSKRPGGELSIAVIPPQKAKTGLGRDPDIVRDRNTAEGGGATCAWVIPGDRSAKFLLFGDEAGGVDRQ